MSKALDIITIKNQERLDKLFNWVYDNVDTEERLDLHHPLKSGVIRYYEVSLNIFFELLDDNLVSLSLYHIDDINKNQLLFPECLLYRT